MKDGSQFEIGTILYAFVPDVMNENRKSRPVLILFKNDQKREYVCLGITSALHPWSTYFVSIPWDRRAPIVCRKSVVHCDWRVKVSFDSVRNETKTQRLKDKYVYEVYTKLRMIAKKTHI